MRKTILITGATDGIGLATAKTLAAGGHRVWLHGRNPAKLEAAQRAVVELGGDGVVCFEADLSSLGAVQELASSVRWSLNDRSARLDVVINNAGVFSTNRPLHDVPEIGATLDVRFLVNTIASYLLTRRLLDALGPDGRVVNLSSAAQSPVDLEALRGERRLSDMPAYAQSKLALTMWSRHLGLGLGDGGPVVVSVNPGSMLGTKMVKDAFGVAGGDVAKGANILVRAALDDDFAGASGQYFDNDSGRFARPHPDALDDAKCRAVVNALDGLIGGLEA
ncbi:MAG: SDR family NAD(P)-dependent oxidoreductase [Acidobacteriota bacterium]